MNERRKFDHTTIIYRHCTQVVVQSHSISLNGTGMGEDNGRKSTMTMMINHDGLSRPVIQ
jgi:hypothetical protein